MVSHQMVCSVFEAAKKDLKDFSIVNDAEFFLEFCCFFYDPMDVGNLIFGPFAFSKSSMSMRNFSVYILLKTQFS